MSIVNLISPFLDNYLLINGEYNNPSYSISPLENVIFKENANISSDINNSLLDYNTSFIYPIEDLASVDYYPATAIQDLPGNNLSTTFDGIDVADRLFLFQRKNLFRNIIKYPNSIPRIFPVRIGSLYF